jgi:diacylglycerol kinase (ATP)
VTEEGSAVDRNPTRVDPGWKTVAIVNPAARAAAEGWAAWRNRLTEAMAIDDVVVPGDADALVHAVRDAANRGAARVLVAGGDGTVSLAAQALAGTSVVLGVVPCGTGNTFAWGLRLPRDERLVSVLAEGAVASVDVGLAVHEGGSQRVFLNSVTIGVSARLVQLLTPEAKRRLGWWAWPRHLWRALGDTPVLTVTVDGPGFADRFQTRQLVVANGRQLAGPLRLPPPASLRDAQLDVFRLGGPTTLSMLRVGWQLVAGRPLASDAARLRRVSAVTVRSVPPVETSADGEVWEPTPVTCRVWPRALRVIVPRPEAVE